MTLQPCTDLHMERTKAHASGDVSMCHDAKVLEQKLAEFADLITNKLDNDPRLYPLFEKLEKAYQEALNREKTENKIMAWANRSEKPSST